MANAANFIANFILCVIFVFMLCAKKHFANLVCQTATLFYLRQMPPKSKIRLYPKSLKKTVAMRLLVPVAQ